MIDKEYITRLTSMTADIRKLNVKMVDAEKIKLNGENLEDLLNNAEGKITSVRHPNDTREVITENDLWGSKSKIENGEVIFYEEEVTNPSGSRTPWNSSITKVEESKAFIDEDFFANLDTNNIIDGSFFFSNCKSLTSFISDISSIKTGDAMFHGASLMSEFKSELPLLERGPAMFRQTAIQIFDIDIPKLYYGIRMFLGCTSLSHFESDLSSLVNGSEMFSGCSSLTSFVGNLSSLTNGLGIFNNCKLDTKSLIHIAETVNDVTSLIESTEEGIDKDFWIGIGNVTPSELEIKLLNEIHDKGWSVYVNGSAYTPSAVSSVMTLDENGEEVSTPIPYYAKPVPATEETAHYVNDSGDFYNIAGAQFIFVDDPETYGMFTCEEDAALNMGLTKIEK